MKLDEILMTEAVVSTAVENIDYIYDKTKNSGDKLHYLIKRIISNWFTEIHSKLGTGATSHKEINKLAALISYAELYVKAKNKGDEETMKFAKPVYDKIIKETKSKFGLKESTVGSILEKQRGFQYQLKKKGKKYFIYYAGKNKKAYSEGVEDLEKLSTIVKPFLIKTSATFSSWSIKLQKKIISRYIEQLKKTLEE